MRLADAQLELLRGENVRTIFDIGTQHGDTTLAFYNNFPDARIFGFEAEPTNFESSKRALARCSDRVDLIPNAVGQEDAIVQFNVATHDGAGSLLSFDDTRFAEGPVETLRMIDVQQASLDSFCETRNIDKIDLCQMDVQGAELLVLQGAATLLSEKRIKLLSCEVLFTPVYSQQPYFWDVCSYLNEFGYGLYDLYEKIYHRKSENILCWADAIFVCPELE